MLDYPAQSFVRFFNNHGLLAVGPQLKWRTVTGGSRSYVERIATPLRARARLATPARAIRRGPAGVEVRDASGHWDRFDRIVLACRWRKAVWWSGRMPLIAGLGWPIRRGVWHRCKRVNWVRGKRLLSIWSGPGRGRRWQCNQLGSARLAARSSRMCMRRWRRG